MTQEDAFLEAIRERPGDDLARLVCADWLEEQDDVRGRYLRVEVELARLAEGEAGYVPREEELRELRAVIEPEWLALAGQRYDLLLHSYLPEKKIHTILLLRTVTGLGLLEAKNLSEAPLPAPVLLGATRDVVERARELFRASSRGQGSVVEVRAAAGAVELPKLEEARLDLLLEHCPDVNRIALLKAIRELDGCGLREARSLVEAPLPAVLRSGMTLEECRKARAVYQRLAEVTVREALPNLPCPLLPRPAQQFDLLLLSYRPERRLDAIRAVRQATNLGLRAARDLLDSPLPVVLWAGRTWMEAEEARALFAGIAEMQARPSAGQSA